MYTFAPLYPHLYRLLSSLFPDCLWSGSATIPEVALTFDDGPHPTYTLELLDVLDRHQVRASFFWLGACVERYPEVARAVVRRGHWIGLHGYDHRGFHRLRARDLQQTLERTQEAIASACQLSSDCVMDVRPPNGLFTPKTLHLLKQWQYRPVMWSVVPEDWLHPGVDVATRRVLAQVQNGAHIVLHDGIHGGREVAATVNAIIPPLKNEGYRFVTIDAFWQQRSDRPH